MIRSVLILAAARRKRSSRRSLSQVSKTSGFTKDFSRRPPYRVERRLGGGSYEFRAKSAGLGHSSRHDRLVRGRGPRRFSEPTVSLLITGLDGASGSTIGPDGALYVTEGRAGRISRVDPNTAEITTFASGLPKRIVRNGGATDVSFIGDTAYALVTMVGPEFGGSDTVGIYRVDGPNSFTIVADIGEFSLRNPPSTPFFVPTGVQYAIETFHGGFLVTDGHHNRVLRITLEGEITELMTFGNIVPTGLAVAGNTVYMAEAGPVPHLPEDARVVSFEPTSAMASLVASGGRLLVDVEFGLGRSLFALAQGVWNGVAEGSPALPNTGALLEVDTDGGFTVVVDGLNQPTSVEFIANTAFVVSLVGEIWRIDDVSRPPYGVSR